MASERGEWGAEEARREEKRESEATRQGSLFEDSIQRKFMEFHARNPHVYDRIVAATRRLKRIGHRNFGMKAIFEGLRWESALQTSDPTGFKLCNSYTSRYVRLVESQCPDLKDFYRKRRLRARLG